jgi:probable F420-dependent oxidoreductase
MISDGEDQPVSKPFRLGCQFQVFRDHASFLESARRMEGLGFDVATFPDHFGGWTSVWPSIAAAAAVTTTLRLGTLTINNDMWNPVVLARDAVSADVLSGGRLELGLGAGWRDIDYEMTGITKSAPSERIARLAESVKILRSYFEPGAFEFVGDHYRVAVPAERLLPAQPRIPIFIGGGGRQIVRLAASEADIVGVHINLGGGQFKIGQGAANADQGVIDDAMKQRLGWIEADRPDALAPAELQLFLLEVREGSSSLEAAEGIAPTFGVQPEDLVSSPWFLTGPPEAMAEKLHAVNEQYGINYFTVREDHLDTMETVIGLLDR